MARKATRNIVIHCSATRPVQDIGVREIRQWHKAKGWKDIGYHFVIRRDGRVEKGRPRDAAGAHVAGHNHNTLGICMVGGIGDRTLQPENNFAPAQWRALKLLTSEMLLHYPQATILGHRDFPDVAKACPCFEAKVWARRNGLPAA